MKYTLGTPVRLHQHLISHRYWNSEAGKTQTSKHSSNSASTLILLPTGTNLKYLNILIDFPKNSPSLIKTQSSALSNNSSGFSGWEQSLEILFNLF